MPIFHILALIASVSAVVSGSPWLLFWASVLAFSLLYAQVSDEGKKNKDFLWKTNVAIGTVIIFWFLAFMAMSVLGFAGLMGLAAFAYVKLLFSVIREGTS